MAPLLSTFGAASARSFGGIGAATGDPIIGPDFILTISNGGTKLFTYDVDTQTLANVTSTYIPSGSPASAGGYEGAGVNGNGTKAITTGWSNPLICATFTTSPTPWTKVNQSSLPNGGGGNSLGGTPTVNSRGNRVIVTSSPSTYYSSASGNSWTNLGYGGYLRACAGHNRFYLGNSASSLRAYVATGNPSYKTTINCGSNGRMSASERTYDPTSYTDPPSNEIIAVSGATSAVVLYTSSTDSYSVIYQGSVTDSIPTTAGAGVTRDGTKAVFATSSTAYIVAIDPDNGTASLETSFSINYGVGFSGDVDIFPSGNAIAVMNNSTMAIYDLKGNELDTISAGTYGLCCVYDGINATA